MSRDDRQAIAALVALAALWVAGQLLAGEPRIDVNFDRQPDSTVYPTP